VAGEAIVRVWSRKVGGGEEGGGKRALFSHTQKKRVQRKTKEKKQKKGKGKRERADKTTNLWGEMVVKVKGRHREIQRDTERHTRSTERHKRDVGRKMSVNIYN
jgi:hypothetical protein